MSHKHDLTQFTGTVTDLFSHRFVISGDGVHQGQKRLADLHKHNEGKVSLKIGDRVEVMGEDKSSEIKIHSLTVNGNPVKLEPKKKHDHDKHDHDGKHSKREHDKPGGDETDFLKMNTGQAA